MIVFFLGFVAGLVLGALIMVFRLAAVFYGEDYKP